MESTFGTPMQQYARHGALRSGRALSGIGMTTVGMAGAVAREEIRALEWEHTALARTSEHLARGADAAERCGNEQGRLFRLATYRTVEDERMRIFRRLDGARRIARRAGLLGEGGA